MKVSDIVISTVGAVFSLAGALGLAYAQSTYSEPQPGTSATTSQDAATPRQDATGTMNQDSTSTTSQDSTGATETPRSSSYNERVARADRN
ncbi:MAG: hypothetical protein ROZ09_13960 [Thiobacillus sp.]|uniref:hypothetical protein n=1 Tax=Thiobacillus sp. TaxID=924 RepID=UPI002894109A|nr:hypothetical protein [Thiobacillus sp.]MDT3707924.1 hypothetical protein [Thiobacillus sp.]